MNIIQNFDGLCACEGSKRFTEIGNWSYCPLEGGGHTSFDVLRCRQCGKVFGFPSFNFDLALSQGTSDVKAKLQKLIQEETKLTAAEIIGTNLLKEPTL
jgi:hypothetical protein